MPDKHEVGGSSPLGPTSFRKEAAQTEPSDKLYCSVVEFGPTSFLKGSTTNKTTEHLVHKLLLGGRVVLVGACVARTNVH